MHLIFLITNINWHYVTYIYDIHYTECHALNGNRIEHISEMKADTELCASLFSVVTLPVLFRLIKVMFA
jgi:hypothetical protein